MPVIGLTRVLPQVLAETRALLAEAWTGAAVPVTGGLSARRQRPPGRGQGGRPGRRAGWPGPGSPPTWSRSSARVGAVAGAVVLFGTGHLFWGTVAVTFFVLLDLLDGALARARGGGSVFGAVLDSVGDRAADAAIFGSLAWWFSGGGRQPAAGPARAGLPGARRPDLLHQGARRGRRASPATSASSSALERLLLVLVRHRAQPGSACRTRCTSRCGCCWPGSAVTVVQRILAVRRAAAGRRAAGAAGRAVTGSLRAPGSPPAPPTPGFAAGWHAVRMLPEPAARGAFDRAGRWAAGRDGKGTRQLRANLRVVTGGALSEPELADAHHPGPALLRPVLAGGLPAADAEQRADRRRHRGRSASSTCRRRATAGAAWSWCCRTAGTGTPPGSGSSTSSAARS